MTDMRNLDEIALTKSRQAEITLQKEVRELEELSAEKQSAKVANAKMEAKSESLNEKIGQLKHAEERLAAQQKQSAELLEKRLEEARAGLSYELRNAQETIADLRDQLTKAEIDRVQGAKKVAAAAGTGQTGPPKKPSLKDAVKKIKMSPLAKLVSTVSEQTTGNRAFDPEEVDGKGDEDFFKLMKQRAADYFSADTDGDGMVNYDEFSSLIAQRADAKDFKQKAVKELFDALDVDKSGKLDLVEYIQWALRESLSKSKGKVLDLFRAWDADGSGQIDKDEFGVVLYSLGFKCSIRDVKKVFDTLDKDGSGEIDYKEMNRALKMGLTTSKLKEQLAAEKKK